MKTKYIYFYFLTKTDFFSVLGKYCPICFKLASVSPIFFFSNHTHVCSPIIYNGFKDTIAVAVTKRSYLSLHFYRSFSLRQFSLRLYIYKNIYIIISHARPLMHTHTTAIFCSTSSSLFKC